MSRTCTEEIFLGDIKNHQIQIITESDVYRHVRFSGTDSGSFSFDLVTWPGYLCYTGDMGSFTFSRCRDMFDFFRSSGHGEGKIYTNTGYWAEKCISASIEDGISEYSPEKAMETITELLKEAGHDDDGVVALVKDKILPNLYDEGELRDSINYYAGLSVPAFSDFWEVNLHVRPYRFIWACYAISWGITKYDESRKK